MNEVNGNKKQDPNLEEVAGGKPNGSPIIAGAANAPEPTEIDKAMEAARAAQNEEIRLEQVRMERLHVSSMALQGLLASSGENYPVAKEVADLAVQYADELLKRIIE